VQQPPLFPDRLGVLSTPFFPGSFPSFLDPPLFLERHAPPSVIVFPAEYCGDPKLKHFLSGGARQSSSQPRRPGRFFLPHFLSSFFTTVGPSSFAWGLYRQCPLLLYLSRHLTEESHRFVGGVCRSVIWHKDYVLFPPFLRRTSPPYPLRSSGARRQFITEESWPRKDAPTIFFLRE